MLSTGLADCEKKADRAGGTDDYVVDPLPVVARESSISLATLRREIKAGRVKVTWMSARRCGIQRRHRREWLDRRGDSPP